uniref:Large ribosomal subunit protein uL14 n=1 Tax=Hymenolepis diminuta TaxID=6216 RepID=A0A0R3SX74_HYMDI
LLVWRYISFIHRYYLSYFKGRGGSSGGKFRITLALPTGAVINCADNTGAKNLYVIAVFGVRGRLNRLPSAATGDSIVCSVKKGKPELRKKVWQAVVIRQRKAFHRKDGTFIYFEDNAGVIIKSNGEMKDQGNHTGSKFRLSLALPVCSVLNCADNSGAKLIYTIGVRNIRGRLNRLPSAGIADSVICSVKRGKANLRRKIWMAVVVRQRKPIHRTDGTVIYFEDNAGVLIKQKGELKGTLITGPVAKECADLWPKVASACSSIH